MIHDQTKTFEWDAMEFEHRIKSTDWYWGLGIVFVTAIVLCIISHNYLLAALLFIGGIMVAVYANDVPKSVHVEISERGIKLDRDLYTHDTIKSFWMYVDHNDRNRLILVTGRSVMPQRIVTLPDTIEATDIREFLLNFIEEKEVKPSTIDLLAEAVGL